MNETNPAPAVEAAILPVESDEFFKNVPTPDEVDEMARLDELKQKRYKMPHEL